MFMFRNVLLQEIDSFPLELASFPQLAANAAFAGNQVYTKADVAAVVAHGRACGVRVVPEVEMPGHMSAYGLGSGNSDTILGRFSRGHQRYATIHAPRDVPC